MNAPSVSVPKTKVHINQYDGEALTRPLSIPSNERTLRFYTKAKVHVNQTIQTIVKRTLLRQ